jgi:hypothetical protein
MILNSSILTRNPDLLTNTINGETVMMSVEKGNYYGFNATGNLIWEFLDSEKKFEELITFLHEKFQLKQENFDNEVIPFIEKLITEQIILIKE